MLVWIKKEKGKKNRRIDKKKNEKENKNRNFYFFRKKRKKIREQEFFFGLIFLKKKAHTVKFPRKKDLSKFDNLSALLLMTSLSSKFLSVDLPLGSPICPVAPPISKELVWKRTRKGIETGRRRKKEKKEKNKEKEIEDRSKKEKRKKKKIRKKGKFDK